jgi:hypothetical protein
MRIAIRITIILAVSLFAAWGIYLLGENTTFFNNASIRPDLEERAKIEPTEGQLPQGGGEGNRPEGGRGEHGQGRGGHHAEASFTQGIAQVTQVLVKISIITALVLALQFASKKIKGMKKVKTASS